MITRSRSRTIRNNYKVTGRENMFLDITLPSGKLVAVSIQTGSVGVDGREYVAIGGRYESSNNSKLELQPDTPGTFQTIIRL